MMMMCCACCGKAEVDEINLRKCNACKSVRYCSVKCQKGHWPQHKKACKKAAELRDEVLFKQPESTHHEDCPICCLPLLMDTHYSIMSCCGKKVCSGCADANTIRELAGSLEHSCPFCRHPSPKSSAEAMKNLMKRIEANDPAANCEMGTECQKKGDFASALKDWTKAAGPKKKIYH